MRHGRRQDCRNAWGAGPLLGKNQSPGFASIVGGLRGLELEVYPFEEPAAMGTLTSDSEYPIKFCDCLAAPHFNNDVCLDAKVMILTLSGGYQKTDLLGLREFRRGDIYGGRYGWKIGSAS